jgi:hypothetical protein
VRWLTLATMLASIAAIVALGTAASLRFGIWGRRITAGLVVLFVLAVTTPGLGERAVGHEAQAITSLRAINAAQLLYSTSLGGGRYARTLDDLMVKYGTEAFLSPDTVEKVSRRGYRLELIAGDRGYAAIAIPHYNPRVKHSNPVRAFCVDERASIYQTLGGAIPAVEHGRCRDTSKPIQ